MPGRNGDTRYMAAIERSFLLYVLAFFSMTLVYLLFPRFPRFPLDPYLDKIGIPFCLPIASSLIIMIGISLVSSFLGLNLF